MPHPRQAWRRRLVRLGAVLGLAAVVLVVAGVFAPHARLLTAVAIDASPERVWAVLTDTDAYPDWNPSMRLTGELAPGATIENREGQGADALIFHPTVLVADPRRELRWRGRVLLPELFEAEHFFLLRPEGAGTVLTQGEAFSGLALWVMDVSELGPRFNAVNAALKARAEMDRGRTPGF